MKKNDKQMYASVAAIVVTYNRKKILLDCINALLNQKFPCDIYIIDNASTDGTSHYLIENKVNIFSGGKITFFPLKENTGGAGGFYFGLIEALKMKHDWFWLMDDDAVPLPSSLAELMASTKDENNIYGSIAVCIQNRKKRLCWPVILNQKKQRKIIVKYDQLVDTIQTDGIPFLGLLIHRNLLKKIGLPDKAFFIYGDDIEYCIRAQRHGSKIILVKKSLIIHPEIDGKIFKMFNKKISYRKFSPWKSYYEVRNKILIGKKYFGIKLWTTTLPGIFIRLIIALIVEKRPIEVFKVYLKATIHGIISKSGIRILPS